MDLDKLSKIIALAIFPLIISSTIRVYTYYEYWNIPVLDYLTSSEILISFAKPGLIISCFGIVIVLYVLSKVSASKLHSNETITEPINVNIKTRKQKIKSLGLKLIGILALLLFGYFLYIDVWVNYNIFGIFTLHSLLLVIIITILSKLTRLNPETLNENVIFVVSTVITFFVGSFFYARFEMHETSISPVWCQFKFNDGMTFNDSTQLTTNNKIIFLGKTSNYYFIYDSTKSQSLVIPVSEVKFSKISNCK